MPDEDERVARIVATLKRSAAALEEAGLTHDGPPEVDGLGVVKPA